MWFVPLIKRFGLSELARALGLPTKNVSRWVDLDSIPAEWFAPVARAAAARGFHDISVELLAARAEARGHARRVKSIAIASGAEA